MHDWPGPRLVPVQVSPLLVNPAWPVSVTASVPLAVAPVLANVKAWDAGRPAVTSP